jgi:hypothetical protein
MSDNQSENSQYWGSEARRQSDEDLYDFFLLGRNEELKVIEWLKSRKVQPLIKKGADFALVFSRKSGIGVAVTATVKLGDTILSEDVTDYRSW